MTRARENPLLSASDVGHLFGFAVDAHDVTEHESNVTVVQLELQ